MKYLLMAIGGYLLLGLTTATFHTLVFGGLGFSLTVGMILFWPAFWFTAIVFALAALGAPHQ